MRKYGIIISGGALSENENIAKYITDSTLVVCADAGYLYALEKGIKPHAVIGDFDSMQLSGEITSKDCEVLTYKVEKDQSDTQLCVDYLISKGVSEILLFGALGGKRFDHTFANLQLLEYGLKKGVRIVIINETTEIFLISDEKVTIIGSVGDYVSVFALHKAEGISYSGLKYPLSDGVIESHVPYGLSNAMEAETASVSVKKGELLIIHTGGDSNEQREK